MDKINNLLKSIGNIKRITLYIAVKSAKPIDLVKLKFLLSTIWKLKQVINEYKTSSLTKVHEYLENLPLIVSTLE